MARTHDHLLLLIGDYGAYLQHWRGKRLVGDALANSAAAGGNSGNEALRQMMAENRKHPLTIYLDTLNQTYHHAHFPKASFFDRLQLMARRLKQTFPETPFKGAIPQQGAFLQQQDTRQQHALLVGVGSTDGLQQWLIWVRETHPVYEIAPLPLEISQLAAHITGEKTGWTILVTLNRVVGVRQVITCDGDFVLARVSPMDFHQRTPGADALAQRIAADVDASRNYIKRYFPKNPPAIRYVFLGNPALGQALQQSGKPYNQLWEVPEEIPLRDALKLQDSALAGSGFVDDILGGYMASRSQPVLALNRTTGHVQDWPGFPAVRKLALTALLAGGGLLLLSTGAWQYYTSYQLKEARSETRRLQQQVNRQQSADFANITAARLIFENIATQQILPETIAMNLLDIQQRLPQQTQLTSITWQAAPEIVQAVGRAPALAREENTAATTGYGSSMITLGTYPLADETERPAPASILRIGVKLTGFIDAQTVAEQDTAIRDSLTAFFPDATIRSQQQARRTGSNVRGEIIAGQRTSSGQSLPEILFFDVQQPDQAGVP